MPLTIKRGDEYDPKLTDFEKDIVASFERHIKLMLVDEWYITVNFEGVEDEAMETEAHPEYRKAEVSVDSEDLKYQPEHLDKYVRHEIMHILVWEHYSIVSELCYKRTEGALRKLEEAVIYSLEHMPAWDVMYKQLDSEDDT